MEKVYKEHVISVGEDLRFNISGPLVTMNFVPSVATAQEHIDKAITAKAKERKVKLNLPAVMDKTGEKVVITGINSGTGNVTGISGVDSYTHFYPDVPWIIERLETLRKLEKETRVIQKELAPYDMRASRAYGRIKPEEYDVAIEKLQAEYKEKLALANKMKK
jgi:hypothetical protein